MKSLVALSFLFIVAGINGPASASGDWLFKGQPKDGGEHYDTTAAYEKAKMERTQLLNMCDAKRAVLKRGGSDSVQDPVSEIAVFMSCGLIYGVDHQRDESELCFDRALAIARNAGDPVREGLTLGSLGIVRTLWGQLSEALDCCNSAVEISARCKDVQNQSRVLNQMGQIHMFRGRYRQALECLDKALSMAQADQDRWLIQDNLGQLYEGWGLHEKARQHYEKGLEIKRLLNLTGAEVASCIYLGRVHEQLGDRDGALTIFRKGLDLSKRQGFPTDNFDDHIGNLLLEKGDMAQAEQFIVNGGFWMSLGRLYLAKSQWREAETCYRKLLGWSEERQIADYLFIANTGLGMVFEGAGDLPKAADHFQSAVTIGEDLRQSLTVPERARFFNVRSGGFSRAAAYEGLARVLLKMNKPSESLKVSEYTKAREFAEVLSGRPEGLSHDVPQDVLNRDRLLNEELAAALKDVQNARLHGDGAIAAKLEPRVSEVRSKLAGHIDDLRARYPLFGATKYPQFMDPERMALNDTEWVLSYDVTDTGIIAHLMKGRQIVRSMFKPISRTELDRMISQFRSSVEMTSGEDLTEKLKSFDLDLGKRLCDILLGDLLGDVPEAAALMVAPDDCLGILSFEMLPLNTGGNLKTDRSVPYVTGVKFLCDRNPLYYCQSVTALSLARTLGVRDSKGNKLLVVADPVFQLSDERAQKQISRKVSAHDVKYFAELMGPLQTAVGPGQGFARLPETGNLAEYLSKMFSGRSDVLAGLDASKQNLLKKLGSEKTDYETVIFATHGYFGDKMPGILEPVLVLTTVPPGVDGLLRMSEVTGLKINVDMVALTACQTGLGKLITGEGVMGMGRAFQYAGARSVLMSLWSVEERASVKLVEHFMQFRKEGKTKLEALASARSRIRQQGYDHPFFWAAFVLSGDPN
ncbi:MAG: CHAT domain-containing protein [Desulfomonile tiedjei]|uniref:CHAT domain-containing protein n=1 Tax=Desulfomonile tiedjei TaxID=2358 RepID=A0A9D6V635_9BACT|nr:CHAT domain-containing protein [Desulfomonile tiedjei]